MMEKQPDKNFIDAKREVDKIVLEFASALTISKNLRNECPEKAIEIGNNLYDKFEIAIDELRDKGNNSSLLAYESLSGSLADELMNCVTIYLDTMGDKKISNFEDILLLRRKIAILTTDFDKKLDITQLIESKLQLNCNFHNSYALEDLIYNTMEHVYFLGALNVENDVSDSYRLVLACLQDLNQLKERNKIFILYNTKVARKATQAVGKVLKNIEKTITTIDGQINFNSVEMKKQLQIALDLYIIINEKYNLKSEFKSKFRIQHENLIKIAEKFNIQNIHPIKRISDKIESKKRQIVKYETQEASEDSNNFLHERYNQLLRKKEFLLEKQLFRSKSKKRIQIEEINNEIIEMKLKANELRDSKVKDLESQISYLKEDLEELKEIF